VAVGSTLTPAPLGPGHHPRQLLSPVGPVAPAAAPPPLPGLGPHV